MEKKRLKKKETYQILFDWFINDSPDKTEYSEYDITKMLNEAKIIESFGYILVLYTNQVFDVFQLYPDNTIQHINP